MAITLSSDTAYSYRRAGVTLALRDPDDTTATLGRIDQLLASAADAYRQRRFDDAVAAYQGARNLLWQQLFPLRTFDETLAGRLDLVRTLVSYGAEWMNVLPVEQAASGVRPREQVALADTPVLGLLSASTGTTGTAAAADLALADELDGQGNGASAKVFRDRATQLAPSLVKAIQDARTAAAVAPVAQGVHGAAPVGDHIAVQPGIGQFALQPGIGQFRNPIALAAAGGVQRAVAIAAEDAVAQPVAAIAVPPALTVDKRSYVTLVGDATAEVQWVAGQAPAVDDVITKVYEARRTLLNLPDVLIKPARPADVAAGLAHAWYYESALGLAECYHALGQWAAAEQWYLSAAKYQYLNAAIEAPYVWSRAARLYLDWGNSLFRADDPASALPIYEKVITADLVAPAADLYTIAGLAPAAAQANNVIANLANPSAITATPSISAVIFDIQSQLAKITGGLDFWGHWAANVPIWTFDYLQSVAVNFCQLAISTERDAINFWQQADSGQLTRLQLTQNVALSQAEQAAANSQLAAAGAEAGAYGAALHTAQLRAADARANAVDYAARSADWTMHQALSAQMSGGDDGNAAQLNQLADRMMQGGYSLSGDRGTLAAAESLTASRVQAGYEIATMNRQANELDAAATQAQQELAAAQARVAAAQAAANAAAVRTNSALQLVAAFDQQRFTPDVWNAMGEKMEQLSQRYLVMALDVAKRMQRAYDFENDVSRSIIRADYSTDAVHGMLAADALMADVQSFTYDQITSTAPKAQPVRQTISLATRYPFLFETQLRSSGRMQFQTDLDDFDSVYPGTYAGRIAHVEIAVDGVVPAQGVTGTLTNAGISHYRVPAALVPAGAVKHRVQASETLVISDYDPRTDALMVDPDNRQRRIFEGAGLASTWTLELPKDVNTLDFAALTDIRLTFSYQARFDPDLKSGVLADLAGRPDAHRRQRPVPLRWLFPDAFFSFYSTGLLAFSLGRSDFGATETDPRLASLSLVTVTTPAARAGGVVFTATAPGAAAVTVTTDADGTVPVASLAAACTGQSAIGDYRIELAAGANPGWLTNGALDLDAIDNIALVVGYSFTPRG